MSELRNRISVGAKANDILIIPTVGLLLMDKEYGYFIAAYKFRVCFAWLWWRMSIGLGKRRYHSMSDEERAKLNAYRRRQRALAKKERNNEGKNEKNAG